MTADTIAKALGEVLIPGSNTITASMVISPELLAKMAVAVVPALDAAGLVVVPRIPTAPMCSDGADVICDEREDERVEDLAATTWAAMLKAAPAAKEPKP